MKKLLLLLALIYMANSANAQWQQTNGPNGGEINCIASKLDTIIIGTRTGVYLSSHSGNNWSPVGLTD